ncbi:LysR family transcriptional regulator [Zwartia vadi]|uniref:LysR family transcriptional regulator n=1 Tax=Zwartia vadi TaxID=3058168 RepID=UPI0025B5E9D5|nr:LysR family transcriptional regulator [Zwartia vadi]MDN3986598.1 LysR substrate-binding domain-containing protein [Zwartia vadi]
MGPGNRPLDLDWLEDFAVLCETENFSRAAAIRCVAQPALSRHIRSLEEWVGVELIDRAAHPIQPTAAGQKFKVQVEIILAALEASRIKARAAHDAESASLRFAVTHSLSLTFFPGWLASLENSHRFGAVQTFSDSFQACAEMMSMRKVQFMLSYGHPDIPSRLDQDNYPVLTLDRDMLVPVTGIKKDKGPQYHLDSSSVIPVLEYNQSSALGLIASTKLKPLLSSQNQSSQALNISVVFTAHNAMLLKTMAISGRGIAWIPLSLVQEELTSQKLALVGDSTWQIPIDIKLYRQKAEMSQPAEAVWKTLLESASRVTSI